MSEEEGLTAESRGTKRLFGSTAAALLWESLVFHITQAAVTCWVMQGAPQITEKSSICGARGMATSHQHISGAN